MLAAEDPMSATSRVVCAASNRAWIQRSKGMSDPAATMKIAVVGGEGIGPEVTDQGRRVLSWFAAKRNIPLVLRDAEFGVRPYLATGNLIPPDTVAAMDEADAILFGAEGGPKRPKCQPRCARAAGCWRCARSTSCSPICGRSSRMPALAETSPLKTRVLQGVDFIVVRELTHGIYFGDPAASRRCPTASGAGSTRRSTPATKSRAVARVAFELARTRGRRVCSVDKDNVLEASRVWREEVQAMHDAEFPDVELSHMFVDNARCRSCVTRRSST